MANSNPPSIEVTELLRNISSTIERVDDHLQTVSTRVLKIEAALEAHDFHGRINKISDRHNMLDTRITILETKGRTAAAAIASVVSVCVSVFAGIVLWFVKGQ